MGTQTEISEAFIATLFAFPAGDVILKVLQEALPQERESRVWTFAIGAIGYAGLLLVL